MNTLQTSPQASKHGRLQAHSRTRYYDDPNWRKPIFLIAGNHENYADIYAISPRTKGTLSDKAKEEPGSGWRRANEGVPADHNLSIYEACLMYGPDYSYWSKNPNFEKEYAD
jgi:hypothetical protein